MAVGMALAQIAEDGQARGVNLSPASLVRQQFCAAFARVAADGA